MCLFRKHIVSLHPIRMRTGNVKEKKNNSKTARPKNSVVLLYSSPGLRQNRQSNIFRNNIRVASYSSWLACPWSRHVQSVKMAWPPISSLLSTSSPVINWLGCLRETQLLLLLLLMGSRLVHGAGYACRVYHSISSHVEMLCLVFWSDREKCAGN